MYGPTQPISEDLHAKKYRGDGENFREAMNRIASALKDCDNHYLRFRQSLLEQRTLPAGRIQSAAGSPRKVTALNCFVSGTIEDSYVDGKGSIMMRALEAAQTMRMGGGIGYDFSTIRPKKDPVRKIGGVASGPVSFMHIFDAVCKCTSSAGNRRGAQMGVLRVDHPDIEEFVRAKQNKDQLTGFNISVAITDEFMRAVRGDNMFSLRWGGRTYSEIRARDLWEMIMRSTWDHAEPGVLFIDRINHQNNLWYTEEISTTNPCGEQPLPPYGACLLGSFNLVKYVLAPGGGVNGFDWELFNQDITVFTRSMDNVIDRTIYPLYEQEKEARAKRRIGMGITGAANALETLGFAYASPDFIEVLEKVLSTLKNTAYSVSADLAEEKGSFPLYDRENYLSGNFVNTLASEVRDKIAAKGIRNSHLTSIAPTGTISFCADNVSSGIEPVFSYVQERTIMREHNQPETFEVTDYAYRNWDIKGRRCQDISVQEHLDVLIAASRHIDSAVSKTCNVGNDVSWEDFKQVYMRAWEEGCKGCTTFRIGGQREGILNSKDEPEANPEPVAEGATCSIDPNTGRLDCS